MGLDRNSQMVYDYKPRELTVETSQSAKDFVALDSQKHNDFVISDLVSKQVGISKLESDAHEDEINERVLARLKELEENAYKQGYELGLRDGTEKAFQEEKANLETRMSAVDQLLLTIETQRKQLLIDNEEQFIDLIFQIGKKIAIRDLTEHREAVVEILRHLVDELVKDERVTIHISTEDFNFIQSISEKSGKKLDKIKSLKMIPEEKMTSGGCLLETSFGSVDATVEERIERTWQILKDRVPQKRHGSEG